MVHNNYCDGSHCVSEHGETRVYPLGAGGNLILCRACFAHENAFRRTRARETRAPENWPQVNWDDSRPYPDDRHLLDGVPAGWRKVPT